MNRMLACLLIGTCCVSTLFSSDMSADAEATIEQENALPVILWNQGEKHFTTSFYSFAKQSGQNLIFSPLSLQLGLAMAAELAYGKTQEEILQIGVLPEEEGSRHVGAKAFLSRLNVASTPDAESVQFLMANSAWISSEIKAPAIEGIILPYYQAEIHQANFRQDPVGMCQIINAWVENNTSHQIQNLLPENALNPQTALVLVNTLYMRAPWAKPFDTELSYEAPFYGIDNGHNNIPYMRQIGKFGFLDEFNHQVIEVPFKDAIDKSYSLSLFIILPKEGHTLEQIEALMTTRHLEHWLNDIERAQLDLSMPKFKLAASLNAKEILQEMGMERPFSPSEAEFDLISPHGRVAITDIVHKAVFEVDERGGTGSAATGIVINPTCWQETKEVSVNRPFMVFVADKTNGLILFAGRVMQPGA